MKVSIILLALVAAVTVFAGGPEASTDVKHDDNGNPTEVSAGVKLELPTEELSEADTNAEEAQAAKDEAARQAKIAADKSRKAAKSYFAALRSGFRNNVRTPIEKRFNAVGDYVMDNSAGRFVQNNRGKAGLVVGAAAGMGVPQVYAYAKDRHTRAQVNRKVKTTVPRARVEKVTKVESRVERS